MPQNRVVGLTGCTLLAAAAATAVWGVGIERHLYTVRRHELRVLPAGSAPLRVLHISDAHLAPWQRRRQRWIASLAALKPDVIVNTGDNLGHRDGLSAVQDAFASYEGIPGVYVHGSNDRFVPTLRNPFKYFTAPSAPRRDPDLMDTAAMDRFLSDDLGWTNLNNTAANISISDRRIAAFGVSDAHRDWDQLDLIPPALNALDGSGEFTIGVTHAPYRRVLDSFIDLDAQMIFAGHTHGGQLRVPGYGALVANCDIPLRQARGLSTWQHEGRAVPLNVSAGIGHSIYAPVRFACRPEASLLTLLPRRIE